MAHLDHPNNCVPHFPPVCRGSIDTFPIFVDGGFGRYQPKYSGNVVKFQAIVSHQGLLAWLTGPHPGAMSDTTIARRCSPPWTLFGLVHDYVLADLAYLSVPHMLTPFKGAVNRNEEFFNAAHSHYGARCEHYFGELHAWEVVVHRGPYAQGHPVLQIPLTAGWIWNFCGSASLSCAPS